MKILKKFPTLCDWCAAVKPTLVYDLPAGTPLWFDSVQSMTVCSSGWIATCEECRKLVDQSNAAHRLAVRFVDLNPRTYTAWTPNSRVEVRDWRERLNRLLLKKITNLAAPRAYVPFEDPLEGKFVEVTPA